jgi:hypothetical protein
VVDRQGRQDITEHGGQGDLSPEFGARYRAGVGDAGEDSAMTYEPVDRPSYGRRTKHDYDAIIATSERGKAVRIPLNGCSSDGVQSSINSLRSGLARRGYKCHCRIEADALIVWAEKIR